MKLLALLDFSGVSPIVLRETRKWAERLSAKVWLLHVAAPDPDFVGYEVDPQVMRDVIARKFHEEHRLLEAAAKELRQSGLEATPLLVQGPTLETILREIGKIEADAVVMGSHGHGALRDLIVGSTTKGVIRCSPCPILLIPPAGSARLNGPQPNMP